MKILTPLFLIPIFLLGCQPQESKDSPAAETPQITVTTHTFATHADTALAPALGIETYLRVLRCGQDDEETTTEKYGCMSAMRRGRIRTARLGLQASGSSGPMGRIIKELRGMDDERPDCPSAPNLSFAIFNGVEERNGPSRGGG